MKTTPTAEDFLQNSHATGMTFNRKAIQEVMIEFAKLHCEAQAKEIVEKAEIKWVYFAEVYEVDKDSILNAYPLTKIK